MEYLVKQCFKLLAKALSVGLHLCGATLGDHHQLAYHRKNLCMSIPYDLAGFLFFDT